MLVREATRLLVQSHLQLANRESGAHNAIVEGTTTALQRPLSAAGYILPYGKVDTERLGMMSSNGNIRPCDWCFNIDQTTTNEMTTTRHLPLRHLRG